MRPRKVALTGHFGEFLQGRLGAEGPVALVTLPCPVARAEVTFTPRAHAPLVASGPLAPLLRRAATAARGQGMRGLGGVLHLRHNVPPGGGAGLSTMAALGTIRALRGPSDAAPEAALCLAVEGATDPLMHREPGRLLWASREARIVETLPPAPRFTVAAGFLGPPLRTDPTSTDFADIADLVDGWRRAAQAGDAPAAAAIATASAERNGRPTGPAAALKACADALGALGIAAAHTGSAVCLLFAHGDRARASAGAAALATLGATGIRRFETP